MTVPNNRYCESHLLYKVSCFLLKTIRRRVSAWWKYWVALCKFSVLVHFGAQKKVIQRPIPASVHHFLETTIGHQPCVAQKMVTQQPIPASVCSPSFSRDDNRTSAGWCGFFLAATGAPSIPIYILADDWCRLQLHFNKYSKELLSLASVRCGPATCLH